MCAHAINTNFLVLCRFSAMLACQTGSVRYSTPSHHQSMRCATVLPEFLLVRQVLLLVRQRVIVRTPSSPKNALRCHRTSAAMSSGLLTVPAGVPRRERVLPLLLPVVSLQGGSPTPPPAPAYCGACTSGAALYVNGSKFM